MSQVTHYFIPALRQGLSAFLGEQTAVVDGRPRLQVKLTLEANAALPEGEGLLSKQVDLFGPSDILGINPSVILRTDPQPNVGDYEPNYFPYIEFKEPDFLWRYSAEAGNTKGTTPWLTLLVLEAPEGTNAGEFDLLERRGEDLPFLLEIKAGTALPDLSVAWRNAHFHAMGPSDWNRVQLFDQLKVEPSLFSCRLYCLRRLEAGKKYTAFVVPTFEIGRARGAAVQARDQYLAWEGNQLGTQSLEMPYYHRWEFRTGLRGDFEYLARLLQPQALTQVGYRPVDISKPGFGLNTIISESEDPLLRVEGAMVSLEPELENRGTEEVSSAYQLALSKVLETSLPEDPTTIPTVGPPLYGNFHVPQPLDAVTNEKGWWADLNLDPRHRIVAGLGDQVMRTHQEQIMEEAWRQLGNLKKGNLRLELGQWAHEVINSYHDRLRRLPPDFLFQFSSHLFSQIQLPDLGGLSLWGQVRDSLLPSGILEGATRRIVRLQGPIRQGQVLQLGQFIDQLNQPQFHMVPPNFSVFDMPYVQIDPSVFDTPGNIPWKPGGIPGMPDPDIPGWVILDRFEPFIKQGYDFGRPLPTQEIYPFREGFLIHQSIPQGGTRTQTNGPTVLGRISGIPLGQDPRKFGIDLIQGSGTQSVRPDENGVFSIPFQDRRGTFRMNDLRLGIDLIGNRQENSLIDIVVGEPAKIRGTLQDQQTGAPVLGTVQLEGTNLRVTTNQNGEFSVDAPPGDYTLYATGNNLEGRQYIAVEQAETVVMNMVLSALGEPTIEEIIDEIQRTQSLIPGLAPLPQAGVALDLNLVAAQVTEATTPSNTIRLQLAEQFAQIGGSDEGQLSRRNWCPKFDFPMYEFLSTEQLVPGVEEVKQNAVGLLKTNRRFVESYLLGLNHAFIGEAIWREYPIPLDCTVFYQFWNVAGYEPDQAVMEQFWNNGIRPSTKNTLQQIAPAPTGEVEWAYYRYHENETYRNTIENALEDWLNDGRLHDIKPISEWEGAKLGAQDSKPSSSIGVAEPLVLLIRGALLKKYPETDVYLVPGTMLSAENNKVVPALRTFGAPEDAADIQPIFAGQFLPDIAFWGFPLTEGDLAEETYFAIFEEPSFQPRFGMDANAETPTGPPAPNTTAFSHFAMEPGQYLPTDHPYLGQDEQALSSADLANLFLQRPVRIAIPVEQLIPKK